MELPGPPAAAGPAHPAPSPPPCAPAPRSAAVAGRPRAPHLMSYAPLSARLAPLPLGWGRARGDATPDALTRPLRPRRRLQADGKLTLLGPWDDPCAFCGERASPEFAWCAAGGTVARCACALRRELCCSWWLGGAGEAAERKAFPPLLRRAAARTRTTAARSTPSRRAGPRRRRSLPVCPCLGSVA